MSLPDNIREEFIHALATYSRRYHDASEDTRMSAHQSAETMLTIAYGAGLIGHLPTVNKVFYKGSTLFVTVDGEDIEIPEW
jgi:hypothetical protein